MSENCVSVIVKLNGDEQRMVVNSYNHLVTSVADFTGDDDVSTKLYWKDEEMDWIYFSTSEEWEEAVELSVNTSLPVHVRIGESSDSCGSDELDESEGESEEEQEGSTKKPVQKSFDRRSERKKFAKEKKMKKIELLKTKIDELETELKEAETERKINRLEKIIGRKKCQLEKAEMRLCVFERRSAEGKKKRFPRRQRKDRNRSRRHHRGHKKRRSSEEEAEEGGENTNTSADYYKKKYRKKRKARDLPIPFDQPIDEYYFDGNNMMYMSNSLRKYKPWSKDGMKKVSQLIAGSIKNFKDVKPNIQMHLVFDNQGRNEKIDDGEGKITVYCARPQYNTADDYLVEMLEKRENKEEDGSRLVVVTSDVELIGRLKSVKEKVWIESPSTWLKKCIRICLKKEELEKGDTDKFFDGMK